MVAALSSLSTVMPVPHTAAHALAGSFPWGVIL
jgi:hypothetical protein